MEEVVGVGLPEDKTAVVTGGGTRIGLAAAVRPAAEGAHVFITGRRKREPDAAAEFAPLDQVTEDTSTPSVEVKDP